MGNSERLKLIPIILSMMLEIALWNVVMGVSCAIAVLLIVKFEAMSRKEVAAAVEEVVDNSFKKKRILSFES